MATADSCCSIVPYFKVPSQNMTAFKALCEQFLVKTSNEIDCLYYGFSFHGDEAHCHEGYKNAEAALTHLDNTRCNVSPNAQNI
jgi:quinol monooxygenase YgiN